MVEHHVQEKDRSQEGGDLRTRAEAQAEDSDRAQHENTAHDQRPDRERFNAFIPLLLQLGSELRPAGPAKQTPDPCAYSFLGCAIRQIVIRQQPAPVLPDCHLQG